jgi:DNA-binding SARP family transcriptional activator/tetratricopeptide (TPR) repeat protein
LRLRTIGGLWIEGEASAFGPRPLGLLALVAAAGKQGISRDRVVGILWSETPEEQARHTLSQTLYNLKRSAGRDVILGATQLRLDASVSSDIGDLKQAVASGQLATVGALYTGKFLDGFYLPGAPEFERWVEEERAGLHREAVRAIERLARQASEARDHPDAIRWWHRLTELDPVSAPFTAGYMQALAATGNRSGALTVAKLHRETVHRELDAEPDAVIRQLEQSLRISPPAPAPDPASPALPLPTPVTSLEAAPLPAQPRKPRRAPLLLFAGALTAIVALAFALRGAATPESSAMPFLAVGEIRPEASADSASIGRVLRDMLATSLGGVEGLQVVANSRLVELMPRGSAASAGMNDAARRAGATEIVEGELARESAGFVLSLRRVALSRGVVRKGYVVRAADRYGIVDSAAAAIARDLRLAAPLVAVAEVRTASPGAYALYDEGLRAHYGYDSPAAYRLMTAALARDSNFAMAAWYVWWLSRHMALPESTTAIALRRVQRLAPRTIERERLLIQASVAEVVAPMVDAVAIAETLSVKYPGDPDGQFQLGVVREKQGDWAGAVTAYQRAFVLDSLAGMLTGPYCRVCQTLGHMMRAYSWWDSAGAAERVGRKLIALRPNQPLTAGIIGEFVARQGRRAEAEAIINEQARTSNTALPSGMLDRDLLRWGRYETADLDLGARLASHNEEISGDAKWLLLLSLRDQGRLREAHSLIQRWNQPSSSGPVAGPGRAPIDMALLGVEMGRPDLSIRVHRENAAAVARSVIPLALRARQLTWNLALAGTAHATAGDTAVVRRLADSLEVIGRNSNWARDTRLHHVLRGLLLQREGKHAEAVEAFRRSLYSLTDGYTRTNLMMARSLLALNRGAEAIPVLRPAIYGGVDGSNSYVSRTELHEALAMAFDQAGQRDSAMVHWRAVESAWRRADPQFRDRYLRAKLTAGG